MYEIQMSVDWSDMDMNGHMGNFAYLKKAAHSRMQFLHDAGFGAARLNELAVGPVVRKDELIYFRELHLFDTFKATVCLAGMSENGSRFRFQTDLWLPSGELATTVFGLGGWLNRNTRALQIPPADLQQAMLSLDQSTQFETLKNSVE